MPQVALPLVSLQCARALHVLEAELAQVQFVLAKALTRVLIRVRAEVPRVHLVAAQFNLGHVFNLHWGAERASEREVA